ncbi:MAG: glycosyltransferase [Betaproteobacteria bacterium]|nr:glycosyltransferase [Betaproteobacteria bacterium]
MYVDPANRFWSGLESDRIQLVGASSADDIAARLPGRDALIITQSRIPDALMQLAARDHVLMGFAHMPILGRSGAEFARYAVVFTVSEYCIGLLRQAGIVQTYPLPLYGTGSFDRIPDATAASIIRARSPYHWDKRKGRDRLLSVFEPLLRSLRTHPVFSRQPGLTLGIVSLISPIKQFPALFALLTPQIARFAQVRLEIFGDGGFAQVRDLRRSLEPIADRVRFWGYQDAVQAIYPQLDYLMTGLPEKEALGLNVLEAQTLGTPVLAPRAPPFNETVLDQKSGFLYRDPREDGGRDFGELLGSMVAGRARPDPRCATMHLAKFSYAAMVERAKGVLAHVELHFPAVLNRAANHG